MIDFTKSPQEIAKELKREFGVIALNMPLHPEPSKDDLKTFNEVKDRLAEKAIQIALQFVSMGEPEFGINPDHTKLTEVLQILKSKI